MVKKKKVRRTLRRPYKILLGLLLICFVFFSLRYCTLHTNKDDEDKYGTIIDGVETTEEPADDDSFNKKRGEDYSLTDEPFTFTVLDVGQGQSIFIDYGEMEVLIDGGYPEYGDTVVEKIQDKVDGDLDYVIATHSDADHVGGLSAVYKAFSVNKTIYGDLSGNGAGKIFEQDARRASSQVVPDSNMTIELGKNATLTIFDVTNDEPDSNDNSVLSFIQFGETTFFASGDAGKDIEKKLRGKLPQCDVVVAGHHGSNTSNSLLDILRPTYFVVSAGANNDYGHPHEDVLSFADSIGSTIFGTFRSGDISFISDGMSVSCDISDDDSLSPEDAGAKVRQKKSKK
ncbi:MBL fold metallo-hydrolase [Anaerovoracaceae bacterium 42-11]